VRNYLLSIELPLYHSLLHICLCETGEGKWGVMEERKCCPALCQLTANAHFVSNVTAMQGRDTLGHQTGIVRKSDRNEKDRAIV
jgi:hypothetical protein